jgi:hypothetical protein
MDDTLRAREEGETRQRAHDEQEEEARIRAERPTLQKAAKTRAGIEAEEAEEAERVQKKDEARRLEQAKADEHLQVLQRKNAEMDRLRELAAELETQQKLAQEEAQKREGGKVAQQQV